MRKIRKGDFHKIMFGEEDNTLIIASSGGTKTCLAERAAQEEKQKGSVIIKMPSPKMNLELGFSAFKPEKKYHLDKLKWQQEKPENSKVKYYLAYSENTPRTKLPPFNIFTLDIKNFSRLLCCFLFEKTEETASLRLLLDTLNTLKEDEGLYSLMKKIQKKVSKGDTGSDSFGVDSKLGTMAQLNIITQAFERFRYNPLIFPHNCPYNLDIENILNDNEHEHIFTSKYTTDIKTRDLINIYILLEIIRLKQSGKVENQVCIVIEELKSFCPAFPVYDFKTTLNKIVSELLSICRGLGINVISSTQIYHEVAREVRGAFNNLVLGKMSDLKDLYEIGSVIKIDKYSRQDILSLGYNEFYFLNVGDGVDEGVYVTFLSKHMHCERGYLFDRIYAKHFPKKIKNHIKELDEIKGVWKNQNGIL